MSHAHTLHSEFIPTDRVLIDGMEPVATVTAIQFRAIAISDDEFATGVANYEVSLCHNGEAKTLWVEPYRLEIYDG